MKISKEQDLLGTVLSPRCSLPGTVTRIKGPPRDEEGRVLGAVPGGNPEGDSLSPGKEKTHSNSGDV